MLQYHECLFNFDYKNVGKGASPFPITISAFCQYPTISKAWNVNIFLENSYENFHTCDLSDNPKHPFKNKFDFISNLQTTNTDIITVDFKQKTEA